MKTRFTKNLSARPQPMWLVGVALICSFAAISVRGAAHHVEYGLNLSLGGTYYEHYEQGEQPAGPVIHQEVIEGYGRVAGNASVGFGVNKARVELVGTNATNPLRFDYGFATSRYWDWFQFSDPALNGTRGFFDATLFVAGSGATVLRDQFLLSPDTEFDAFWHAVINVTVDGVNDPDGSPIQSVYYAGEWIKEFGGSTLDYIGDPLNTYQRTGTFEFIYGQPILMDTFLQVDVQFDNQTSMVAGTLDSMIDLGNSSYWGGIRRLRDAAGNPVTNAVYTSSSGVDYRASAMAPPNLQFRRIGGALQLEWTGSYRLQSAPAPAGNYTTLSNATSPYWVQPTAPQQFFRLVQAQ